MHAGDHTIPVGYQGNHASPNPTGKGIYSIFFLVLKKNIDLKWLNMFLHRQPFKMETWRSIVATLEVGDLVSSINLSEAFLHILILPSHHRSALPL